MDFSVGQIGEQGCLSVHWGIWWQFRFTDLEDEEYSDGVTDEDSFDVEEPIEIVELAALDVSG